MSGASREKETRPTGADAIGQGDDAMAVARQLLALQRVLLMAGFDMFLTHGENGAYIAVLIDREDSDAIVGVGVSPLGAVRSCVASIPRQPSA